MFNLFFPFTVFAAEPDPGGGVTSGIPSPSEWLPFLGARFFGTLPYGGTGFLTDKVIPFVISVLLFAVIVASLIFLLVGGIKWITSGGDKEGTAKAKGTVTYAIVGLVLGLLSFLILNFVTGLISGGPPPKTCADRISDCIAQKCGGNNQSSCALTCYSVCTATGQECYIVRSQCYQHRGCLDPALTPPQQISCMNDCDRYCTP